MMKVLRRFNRNIRDAFKSVIRNFSLSIASISCITITLIVVSTSIIMSFNVDNFTNSIKKDVTVVVYLDGSVDEEKRNTIEEEIKKTNNIASMEFKSKEKTAEEFKNESEVIGSFLETLGENENPLLDSYMIKVKDISIFYDYAGIKAWAVGEWKRNKKGTTEYYNYITSVRDSINIRFVKVRGHSGVEGNEEADRLAKRAVGLC